MKQRDQRGRYTRVYRKASRWEVLCVYSVLGGILLGFVYDVVVNKESIEVVHVAQAQVVEVVPAEVMVEVVYETDGIERLIRETFVETPNTAVAVAKAESGALLKADAYNPEWHYDRHGNKICQGSYGVMQVACVHNLADPDALFDVEFNIKKAREIYEESQSFQRWGGYRSGGYKKYLQ